MREADADRAALAELNTPTGPDWPRVGDLWINPLTGMQHEYTSSGWRTTDQYPHGYNPLRLLRRTTKGEL